MLVDFDFYKNTYGGKVSETDFPTLEIQAAMTVKYYTFNRVTSSNENVRFAVCDLVDYLYQLKQTGGKEISSESVSTHSVSYVVDEKNTVDKKKKDIIKKYLAHTGLMYRGR